MPLRTIKVVTKLTAEAASQPWDFGHVNRISVLDPTQPTHFPCHIIGSTEGLIYTHGTEAVAVPWDVIRRAVESVHDKMIAPPVPKPADVQPHIKAAIEEAQKLPQ